MQIIDSLIQQLRSIPEKVRSPMISDKEIEEITQNILVAHEYEYNRRMEIK